jgi:hypothetical protein
MNLEKATQIAEKSYYAEVVPAKGGLYDIKINVPDQPEQKRTIEGLTNTEVIEMIEAWESAFTME